MSTVKRLLIAVIGVAVPIFFVACVIATLARLDYMREAWTPVATAWACGSFVTFVLAAIIRIAMHDLES